MTDEWMPHLELPLNREQFHQLPRNAAYKYELIDGKALLSPRPKHYHAVLDLRELALAEPAAPDDEVRLRPLREADWPNLVRLFAVAFDRVQPFGSLDEVTRQKAAERSLEKTRSGGDGPLAPPACFVAEHHDPLAEPAADHRLLGAALVTLLPEGDPCDFDSYYWTEPPPADCWERRLGRPHLTWIFVAPLWSARGVGTALLQAAGRELTAHGCSQLFTTFLLGNDTSALWHWRNGFRLLTYPGSQRRWRKRYGV